jgi:hypothetical protein
MKRFFFLLAMLVSVAASATVTITPLSVNYNTKQVTFSVTWTGAAANDRVWVWVDLCPVTGTSPSTFAKAIISEATGSGVVAGTLNERGFYVNAKGATVTATLDNATGKFNWCAYGSDFPPNAIQSGSVYNLKGSPPFIITISSGTVQESSKTFSGGTILALTDATGCPGVLCGKNGEAPGLLGCCDGTTNCSETCRTDTTYQVKGKCLTSCHRRNADNYDQCGFVNTVAITDPTACTAYCNCGTNSGGCTFVITGSDCASCSLYCSLQNRQHYYQNKECWCCNK